ncbi:MAG: response regulator transcription factor [Spirochaetales bacterium]|nr:response regulator transcription factor [Spirochaetales bacterium]
MPNKLKTIGFLFAGVFALGYLLNVVVGMVRNHDPAYMFFSMNQAIMLLSIALFAVSALVNAFRWIQPILFLAMTPVSIITDSRGIYGLGFFIVGVLLLERAGFFLKRRAPKVALVGAYLLAVEIAAAFLSKASPVTALAPTFFIAAFALFLWFLYKDRLVVYLSEPKAMLSLTEKGLSNAERAYVLAAIRGKQQKEVAIDFEVAESTVRNTLARAYHKLCVDDKAGLAALAEKYEITD